MTTRPSLNAAPLCLTQGLLPEHRVPAIFRITVRVDAVALRTVPTEPLRLALIVRGDEVLLRGLVREWGLPHSGPSARA
eukprot:4408468-Alexandrium_andersonii.AAC.1